MNEDGAVTPPAEVLPAIVPKQPKDGTERLRPHQWQKGQAGNPGGRTKLHAECNRIAREMAPEALYRAGEIMRQSEDERAALVAIGIILDRGLGKAKEPKEEEGAARPDLSGLSSGDLAAFRALISKILSPPPPAVDATATPPGSETE